MRTLYVSDLDGTLLNSVAELSEETISILNEEIEAGLNFTISTARTPTTALKILKRLDLQVPIMMMNGVLVYDLFEKKYIRKATMDRSIIMVLLGLIKTKGLDCFLYSLQEDEFFAYYDSVESTSLNYFRNERMMKFDKKFTEVADLSLVAGNDIIYCMLREPKQRLEMLAKELKVVKGVKTAFYPDVYNDEYYMLEIYSDQASKKTALSYLKEYGSYEYIVSFGDNLNDIPLYEASDEFYAVANAHPEIQHMANGIIGSNEQNGVAKYIRDVVRTSVNK